jgi:hypothetical protein
MEKKCPRCGLYNPAEAQRCDCGYDFASGQVKTSYLSAARGERATTKPPRTTAAILFSVEGRITRTVFWVVSAVGV